MGLREGFGAGCFLAAARVGEVAGRGAGNGGGAAGVEDTAAGAGFGEDAFAAGAVARGADDVVVPGSGVMMLTGGVEAALGNSALVGLPVGTPGTSAVTAR